jgi:hypothetical protein
MQAQIDAIVAAEDFGRPHAQKRGRNPSWPYVPVVMHGERQEQITGCAYATREEALAMAEKTLTFRRDMLRKRLGDRSCRSLREQYGLPREI